MNTVTTTIPQPPRRWLLRFGLPVGLLLAVAALLLATAWSSIVPAPSVATATALLREVETEVVADMPIDEAAIVQAPGWVEAEPYSVYAGALAEGVVQEILVLEGDRVTKGQAVARLVPDEAQIVLRQKQACYAHGGSAGDRRQCTARCPCRPDRSRPRHDRRTGARV